MKTKYKKDCCSGKKKKYVLVWVNKEGFFPDSCIDTTDWEFYKPNKKDDRYNVK